MKKRTLAISDIHGMYDQFAEMLRIVKFNPNDDQLVLLGDYIDRGPKSKQVVELVMGLVQEHGAIALRGNHDQMFLDFIDGIDYSNFLHNGGMMTLVSYIPDFDWNSHWGDFDYTRRVLTQIYSSHIDFIRGLPYYYETDEHIFVHGGINPLYEDWKSTPENQMIWIRDLFIDSPTQTDKTVIFGHTPCVNLHETEEVWFGGDKIGIDGACAYGMQLNCLEICEEGYKTHKVLARRSDVEVRT